MIENRQQLKEYITTEFQAYGFSGKKNYLKRLIAGSETAIIWKLQRRLRVTEYYYNTQKHIRYALSKTHLNRLENKYSIHVGINTCGKGLKIMHLGPVLINGNAKLGRNVSIHINVTIAASGTSNGAPSIGDDVVIGVGAVILGPIHIANGIAIGANAVVTKDFGEPDITIAGVPAKKVSNGGKKFWK